MTDDDTDIEDEEEEEADPPKKRKIDIEQPVGYGMTVEERMERKREIVADRERQRKESGTDRQ